MSSDLTIERRDVAALIPYARNSRKHSPAQISAIAGSMREFGFVNPILVAEDGTLIAGHARLMAAQQIGMTDVPVIVLRHLTDAQRRAYVIADNRLAELATWDVEMLRIEVRDILADGDVALTDMGWDDAALRKVIGDWSAASGITDEAADEAPAVDEKAISRPGDVWRLGDHRVVCGDALDLGTIHKALGGPDGLADMTFTDPPYNVAYKGGSGGGRREIANDALGEGFEAFLTDAMTGALAVTKGALYVCMSSSELDALQRAFKAAGGHWSTFIVWAKNTFTIGRSDYQRQYEPILYGWAAGKPHYWCGARDQGDVWFFDKPARNDLHPTMKPVALVERAIRNSSKERDTVLDLFGGSGTTLMAAERTGRRAALVELDPRYVDVIVRRWQGATGRDAVLESDGQDPEGAAGQTFVQIEAERGGVGSGIV